MSDERTISITEAEAKEILYAESFCADESMSRINPPTLQKIMDAFPKLAEDFDYLLE